MQLAHTSASEIHHCNGGSRLHDNILFSKVVGGHVPLTDLPSRRWAYINILDIES